MTPEEELLDGPNAHLAADRSLYSVHDNEASEKDGDDKDGLQGGQGYSDPTLKPTPQPTATPTQYPTRSPTNPPTKQGQKYVIMGTTWYDRNANGIRDSNVEVAGLGSDVEFQHAVSGMTVKLIECDPSNGREYIPPEGEVVETYANVITAGLGGRGEAQIVKRNDSDGRYKIVVLKGLQRHYYIQVDTPNGFLITTGACNDDVRGFECDYSTAVQEVTSEARALSTDNQRRDLNAASAFAVSEAASPAPLGIRSGRSDRCVFVDREGNVEFNIDVGIMRVDDSRMVDTNVALLLEFDEEGVAPALRGRGLEAILDRGTVLGESRDGTRRTTRYLLGDSDKLAIGTVTAEILALALDKRLAASGIELDDVTPKEVVISRSSDSSNSQRKASELAVAMQIKGHYNPPPDLDFDFIVQDSINRDTPEIRRNLREYNDNCRDQSSKTEAGYTEEDYSTVVSTTGAGRPVGRGGSNSRGDILPQLEVSARFSKACSSNKVLPAYFETSLKEIEAKSIRVVRVSDDFIVANEDGAIEGWAMGPVAAIAGLIALLVGAFVFRRAIGRRAADKYKESNKTKEVDMYETRRFGEGRDDSSVDSDFYSDDEEDEKGRKISRKEKEDMAAKGRWKGSSRRDFKKESSRRDFKKESSRRDFKKESSRRDFKKESSRRDLDRRSSASALRASLTKGSRSLRKSKQSTDGMPPEDKLSKRKNRASRAKLATSEKSDDTDSLDKGSISSDEKDEQLKRSEKRKKRRSKMNVDGSERKSKSDMRRGRSSRAGGDNAKLFEDSIS